jgi:catechol 2,3-dioxygenase-like lactoylglutathione lyase family enzyme
MNFTDVTPNLVVSDIERSTAFYRDVLGFAIVANVPEQPPFAFVWLQRGGVNVFLSTVEAARHDVAEWGSRAIGGTMGMFIVLEAESVEAGIDALFVSVGSRARVLIGLRNQFYGMREFTIEDPDGYVVTFAQRIG